MTDVTKVIADILDENVKGIKDLGLDPKVHVYGISMSLEDGRGILMRFILTENGYESVGMDYTPPLAFIKVDKIVVTGE